MKKLFVQRSQNYAFLEKKLDKYECLPELIFLINEYSKITTFEIDLNMQSGNLSEDDIQFF